MIAVFVVSGAVAIDVLPCSRIGEGQVVRPDANHGPIFLVLPVRVECLNTGSLAESPRPWRCSRQQRPRDSAQRMEEDVVDNEAQLVGQDLIWWSALVTQRSSPNRKTPCSRGILQLQMVVRSHCAKDDNNNGPWTDGASCIHDTV